MTNYEAILAMSPARLAAFLEEVTLAGVHTGLFAANLSGAQRDEAIDERPYDEAWLGRSAEGALVGQLDHNGDPLFTEALTRAVLRAAGLEE